jgi:hypothetical protein
VAQQHLGAGIKQESSQTWPDAAVLTGSEPDLITSVGLAPNVPIVTTGEAGPPEPNPPSLFFSFFGK